MRSLCCVVSQMIRRSLTSGNDRKDESRNAMMKRPGPPRETAKPLIHSTKPAISPKCRLESALATTTPHCPIPSGSGRDDPPVRQLGAALIALATLVAGGAAAFYYSTAGLALSALRRARPPRRRASHPRQPDARLAADWRRVAAAPPRPQHAAGSGRRVVPDGRLGDRDLGRGDGRRRLGARVARSSDAPDRSPARLAGAALLLANPNVLYLQSTPMTEPLLFGTTLLAVALTADWVDRGAQRLAASGGAGARRRVHDALRSLADLRRLVALALVVLAAPRVPPRECGDRRRPAVDLIRPLPSSSSCSTAGGRWARGSSAADSSSPRTKPSASRSSPGSRCTRRLSPVRTSCSSGRHTRPLRWSSGRSARSSARASLALVLALVAAAALPWYAYLEGHPFRIRYGVPLVVACARDHRRRRSGCCRAAARRRRRTRGRGKRCGKSRRSIARRAVIAESQRDAQNHAGRQAVTAYLRSHYDGEPIMMSMGRSPTTCTICRARVSRCTTSCTRATARCGQPAMQYGPAGSCVGGHRGAGRRRRRRLSSARRSGRFPGGI